MRESPNNPFATGDSGRHYGLDLARIVFMLLIVLRHGTYQSGATTQVSALKANYLMGVLVNDVTAVAVNGFVLISAWFLCMQSFRFDRLVRLWRSVLFYSLGVLAVAWAIGFPLDGRRVLSAFLPISMNTYWFVSKYFLLVALAPFLNRALSSLERRPFRLLLGVLVFAYSLLPSMGVTTFYDRTGYTLDWFVVLYVTAVYLRRFGGRWTWRGSLAGYLVAMLLSFFWLTAKFLLKGKGVQLFPPSNYNFLMTYLASVFLFHFFASLDIRSVNLRRVIGTMAPLTLGVYLFHDHLLKRVLWSDVLGIDAHVTSPAWALYVTGSVLAVYLAGSAVEWLRRLLFGENGAKRGR